MEEGMERKLWLAVGIITLFLLSAACAGPSRVELDYGTSAKLSKFNQVLNPEAGKNLEPVTGLDGGAAKGIMEKYQKDFEKPAPPPAYMLTFGGTGAK